GPHYRLAEEIRRRVTFRPLNLARDVYPLFATGTWGLDLILCRNVLIYFDAEVTRRVAGRLLECLTEGGWLITASSDPPLAGLVLSEAERACAAAVSLHPLSAELAYLNAVLRLELRRDAEAAELLRRVLYLDGTLAAAHFTLGSVLQRLGDTAGARRAFRN